MRVPTCRTRVCLYLVSILASGLALFLQSTLGGTLDEHVTYLLLYPTVFFVSWFGGLGPGLLSVALCALGALYFFVQPYLSLVLTNQGETIRLIFFSGMGILICALNSRLRKAEEFARDAMISLEEEKKARERFLATLAHDLRNPLAGARAAAELVQRFPERQDLREIYLRRVVSAIGRADRMIEDLLDADRVQAGATVPLRVQRIALPAVLQEVVGELSLRYGQRFILDCESRVEMLMGYWDPEQLKRVIENLAGNAVKYGDQELPITIGLRCKEKHVRIFVHNHGSFLSERDRSKLFQPYHRTSSAQQSGARGWGLGLIVVRGIAEAHGGRVGVESDVQDGTVFWVELPMDARKHAEEGNGLRFESGDRPELKKAV